MEGNLKFSSAADLISYIIESPLISSEDDKIILNDIKSKYED